MIKVLKEKYLRSRKGEKGEILDAACKALEVGRKQAIRLLNSAAVGRPRNPVKRGRPSMYQDHDFKAALKRIWRMGRIPCSRALKAAIPHWLVAIEAEYGAFRADVRERLLLISAPTMDRILRPYKVEKGKSLTRSGGFRDEIPKLLSQYDPNGGGARSERA